MGVRSNGDDSMEKRASPLTACAVHLHFTASNLLLCLDSISWNVNSRMNGPGTGIIKPNRHTFHVSLWAFLFVRSSSGLRLFHQLAKTMAIWLALGVSVGTSARIVRSFSSSSLFSCIMIRKITRWFLGGVGGDGGAQVLGTRGGRTAANHGMGNNFTERYQMDYVKWFSYLYGHFTCSQASAAAIHQSLADFHLRDGKRFNVNAVATAVPSYFIMADKTVSNQSIVRCDDALQHVSYGAPGRVGVGALSKPPSLRRLKLNSALELWS